MSHLLEVPSAHPMNVQKPRNFPFEVSQVNIVGRTTRRAATVLTPKRKMMFDRAQLKKVGTSDKLSPVERWLVDHAARNGESSRITILRAVNSRRERLWLFDPDFDNEELAEAGYVLTKALLPFHRAFMAAGVVLMVHSDWGERESYGIRAGVWRCVDELMASSELAAQQEADLWVLKNMVHHMSLSLDHVVRSILPNHLGMIERRWARVRETVRGESPPRSDSQLDASGVSSSV